MSARAAHALDRRRPDETESSRPVALPRDEVTFRPGEELTVEAQVVRTLYGDPARRRGIYGTSRAAPADQLSSVRAVTCASVLPRSAPATASAG